MAALGDGLSRIIWCQRQSDFFMPPAHDKATDKLFSTQESHHDVEVVLVKGTWLITLGMRTSLS